MKGPTLPDPDTWDRMTAEEQWDFMRLSAMCAAAPTRGNRG
jgi:hypothetical protein